MNQAVFRVCQTPAEHIQSSFQKSNNKMLRDACAIAHTDIRTDGMESEFRRGWRVQCVLQGTVVSCTPLTGVQTRTCPLLTLPGSTLILMKSGTIICDCCALGEKG
ncbi:unnamed protein product [Leuciscus chuanchicus]